uniref:Voltage-dependent calcium channel alpha-2/delta subunit conserved region domain-containing protein n=1 Tax=Ciona savignyi TaxID=51511 RepID=H2ZCM8_CIOSA
MYQNTSSKGIEMTFFMSRSGVIRKYWHVDAQQSYKDSRNNIFRYTRTEYPSIYRRTVNQPKDTWLYTIPTLNEDQNVARKVIIVTKALRQKEAILGVSGLMLKYQNFATSFWNEAEQTYGVDCTDKVDKRYCYIVDNNANVVLSSQNNEVGRFFGEIHGHVMNQLIEAQVFNRIELVDSTAMCIEADATAVKDSARSSMMFKSPFFSLWAYFTWWTKELVMIVAKVAIYNWWTLAVASKPTQTNNRNQPNYRPCKQKYEVFVSNRSKTPYTNRTLCGENYPAYCEGEFGIYNISNSNLYLIVTQQIWPIDIGMENCNCSGKSKPFAPLRGKEIKIRKEDRCSFLTSLKERRRPDTCTQEHRMENMMKQPCTTEVKPPSNSAAHPFPTWWRYTSKPHEGFRTMYTAWMSCLTIHMVIVAIFAVICNGALLRTPVLS